MNYRKFLLSLKEGEVYHLETDALMSRSVDLIKNVFGDNCKLKFSYEGVFNLKVTVVSEGCSPKLVAEKLLDSKTLEDAEIDLDLTSSDTGSIDIAIYAISDVYLYQFTPSAEPMTSVLNRDHTLYDFQFPSLEYCIDESLYCKFSDGLSYFSSEDKIIHLFNDGSTDLLTYFNSFSAMKWAEFTNVDNLSVFLDLKGFAEVSIDAQFEDSRVSIARYIVSAKERATFLLPVPFLRGNAILGVSVKNISGKSDPDLGRDRLSLSKEGAIPYSEMTDEADSSIRPSDDALPSTEIYGGGWYSQSDATQNVKLGVVVTAFENADTVISNVLNLKNGIKNSSVCDNVSFTVIDNRNVLSADLQDIDVVSLKTIRGGYNRFLPRDLTSPDAPLTHCLFMDDDAVCEAGAILRSISFLSHVTDKNVALCGGLLSENARYLQVGCGELPGDAHQLNNTDFDLRDPIKVFENEADLEDSLYGSWWYFLIPVGNLLSDSLFFLESGDNKHFSIVNQFKTVTLNGISCWQHNFQDQKRIIDEMNERKLIVSLKEGDIYVLPKDELIINDVSVNRKIYGNKCQLKFAYHGILNVKVGVRRDGYSFKWIAEKLFKSPVVEDAALELDLTDIANGTIEVTFFAVSEAMLFHSMPLAESPESQIDDSSILYEFAFPNLKLCSEEPLYCKFSGGFSYFSNEDRSVHLFEESSVDFLTYFNSFSSGKWTEYTNVRKVSAFLDIKGNAEVSVVAQYKNSRVVVDRYIVAAPERRTCVLPVSSMKGKAVLGLVVKNIPQEQFDLLVGDEDVSEGSAKDKLLELSRKSLQKKQKSQKLSNKQISLSKSGTGSNLSCTEIYGGGWLTDDVMTNQANLGIVITSCDNEEAVAANVARLTASISESPVYKDRISITVLDNGGTLSQEQLPGAELVLDPEKSGYERAIPWDIGNAENPAYCLFMDDDATCEAGSILRSLSFLSHASSADTAITGSLLSERIKFNQDIGAEIYDGDFRRIGSGFDLRDPVKLCENEESPKGNLYGSWWYFLVPVKCVSPDSMRALALGDSGSFSKINSLKVVTMNGVSCWKQDFQEKSIVSDNLNERKQIAKLKKGEIFALPKDQLISSSVNTVRKLYGDKYPVKFSYQGIVNVKVGISRPGYSFKWISEKMFKSPVPEDAELVLDLSSVETGTIEITFFAVSDAVIYQKVSSCSKPVTEFDRSKVLYDFLFPNLDLCSEEPLYIKFSGGFSYYSHEDKTVHLFEEASVDFLTYFNSFSSMKWMKYTNVRNLSVYLDIEGNAEVTISGQYKNERIVTDKFIIHASERGTYVLPISSMIGGAVLGISVKNLPQNTIEAFTADETSDALTEDEEFLGRANKLDDPVKDGSRRKKLKKNKRKTVKSTTEIYGGGWLTDDKEMQDVNLGIVITTFKREDAVKAAVSRLVRDVSAHDLYSGKIDIAVIDNGNTLKTEDVAGALLVKNRNLGGTGGFTRGLIHFQETGKHTHCLFMDDDASCEAGAIFRSMSFQRHVTDHKVSLSGAMLFENIKFMQWENGAWFDGGCHSIKRDFDMRDPVKLYENEEDVDLPIYGAWWFFFFPLDEAKNYSLPFFVRGDDIDFSYANDFKVVSLNGVSCWQQDFKTKENAMTAYLFLRSHMVHHMTVPRLKCSYLILMKILWGHFREYNNSYFYGTAACVNLAMRHVMEGPKFWEDNIVPVDVLKEIKELSACEKPVPYTEDELRNLGLVQCEEKFKTKRWPFFIRRKSLYGHLLPKSMIKFTEKAMLPKWMTPYKEFTYMRSQVTVLDELNRTRTVLKRSPGAYFKNLFTFIYLALKLRIILSCLHKRYQKAMPIHRSREFWKKQFSEINK